MVTRSEIVLIQPLNDMASKATPLGLLHLGTLLDLEGYNVKIIDATREKNYKSAIVREVKNALLVGISCLTTEVKSGIEISDLVKATSDVPIIWGGWHPTLFPTQTCSDKSVDFVCMNEGEYTLLKLAKKLESENSFEDIEGLVYKSQWKIRVNPTKGFVDLEKLPPVNYDLVDMTRYVRQGDMKIKGEKQIPYESSRGCPHRCSFCINTATGNQVWRKKSARKIVDELEILVEKYGINSIDFVDDNFFVSLNRVEEFCKEMIARKLSIMWYAECRADYFDRMKPKLLDLCQKSGLSRLYIGAESGAQRILRLLKKDITVEQIINSARILSKYDIEPVYSFILGVPWETDDEVKMTVKLAEKLRRICRKTIYRFSLFTPYPKCETTTTLLAKDLISEPGTLRGWTEDDVRKRYVDRFAGKPWQRNPKLLENLSFFAGVAYDALSDRTIADCIKRLQIPRYPNIFFVYLARIRMKTHCYGFPIDRYVRGASRVFQL
jgi:anaerobic magnesium-protoporphyrin IX monomethyl ester cyclase